MSWKDLNFRRKRKFRDPGNAWTILYLLRTFFKVLVAIVVYVGS